ncbi:Protein PLASTID MOVEMENT IMPAIRED 2 [Quillaja saponaria]|uniref:Protein PLASTID MOVEMENT IMPAIRED 2 n=1 Tax=Quillaja saponaria TaxID=32244 RepID=A0AAD7PXZ8_QUISA|nr:Protein PLASTID MOVEMENT IMPAIRED 2 [Quillaja saponaria]
MDEHEFDTRKRIGTVKAAIDLSSEKNVDGTTWQKRSQMNFSEKSSSSARELHIARRDKSRYKESRMAAESAKVQAESELSNAKKKVKELFSLIEESNSKVKATMRDTEKLKKQGRQEQAVADRRKENCQYAEVMRELQLVKQELQKLKQDVASVLKEKSRAEREIQESSSKILSLLRSGEVSKKEIEEVNEELVLVELASVEALQEFGDIEARREREANQFSTEMENNRKKLKDIIEEIDNSKELEARLAGTMSDVNVLQNELILAREMDRRVQRSESLKHLERSFRKTEESETLLSLQTITEELGIAKKDLASIKVGGFQFMASMDIIRNELKHITNETIRLQKSEEKTELTVQKLNSKLLRANSKLETLSAAESRTKSILANLSKTLGQLKTEAAKNEKELITEEGTAVKAEIRKTESEMDLTEERLRASMQELEAVKLSETLALDKLKSLIENTMRRSASEARHSSMITIKKFEYEYLTAHAAGAEEVTDKKVAAAQAWVEALKASEKEILMKTEMAQREIKEMRIEEEMEAYTTEKLISAKKVATAELENQREKSEKNAYTTEKSLSAKKVVTGGLENRRGKGERNAENNLNSERGLSRKSTKATGNLTPARQAKFRKSTSPGAQYLNSITIKKKKKVMPNLANFFSGKKTDINL